MARRTYGAEEARAKLPELLERAHHGIPTLITKHGKPYALLSAPGEGSLPRRAPPLSTLKGSGAGFWGKEPSRLIAKLRDEWE